MAAGVLRSEVVLSAPRGGGFVEAWLCICVCVRVRERRAWREGGRADDGGFNAAVVEVLRTWDGRVEVPKLAILLR